MRFLTNSSVAMRRMVAGCGMLGLAAVGVAAAPQPAEAWWHGGWCCAVGIGLPPVVVAPAPVYVPPPAYYAPPPAYYGAPVYYPVPQRPWIPGHWIGGYWVRGHWG
ncbi:MAG TPA: hypothetical protein VMB34_30905 [Acetobacteraceae bacterium]|nr:hypothetical protein [Acetobacteraceae bacterium]